MAGWSGQRGAALVVGLALVTATALLATAAVREVTLEAAKTASLAAHVQARMSAESAIELALAEGISGGIGTEVRQYPLGPDAAWQAAVTIRHLGSVAITSNEAITGAAASYYELIADVSGPRGARDRRRRLWTVNSGKPD